MEREREETFSPESEARFEMERRIESERIRNQASEKTDYLQNERDFEEAKRHAFPKQKKKKNLFGRNHNRTTTTHFFFFFLPKLSTALVFFKFLFTHTLTVFICLTYYKPDRHLRNKPADQILLVGFKWANPACYSFESQASCGLRNKPI